MLYACAGISVMACEIPVFFPPYIYNLTIGGRTSLDARMPNAFPHDIDIRVHSIAVFWFRIEIRNILSATLLVDGFQLNEWHHHIGFHWLNADRHWRLPRYTDQAHCSRLGAYAMRAYSPHPSQFISAIRAENDTTLCAALPLLHLCSRCTVSANLRRSNNRNQQ